MGKKPGRNDPCPCGSGRKLKRCHGFAERQPAPPPFAVRPARVPEPITTHAAFDGEKWVRQPGLLVARVSVQAVRSVDPELIALRSKWGKALPEGATNAAITRLNDIEHKLQAVRYHRDNYERHEDELLAKFRLAHVPPAGVQVVEHQPKLVYEVEAFLFQVKSTLDMLARLLYDLGYRSAPRTFGDKGDGVIRTLDSFPNEAAAEAATIKDLILGAQSAWLDEAVATRDRIAHSGALDDLTCFIEEPYVGGQTVRLHYPTMPGGKRARGYIVGVEADLRTFVDTFVLTALRSVKNREASP